MLNKGLIQALGFMAIAAFSISTASAGVIYEMQSFGLTNAFGQLRDFGGPSVFGGARTNSRTLSLSKFDASLGNLDSVIIEYDGQWSHFTSGGAADSRPELIGYESRPCGSSTCSYPVYSNETGFSGTTTADFSIAVIGSLGLLATDYDANSVNCSQFIPHYSNPACDDSETDVSNVFAGFLTSAATPVSSFIGPGPLNFQISTTESISGYCDNYDDALGLAERYRTDRCDLAGNVNWSGSVSVTYNYSEASVPEPAVLSMLSAGLLGLGINRRRRALKMKKSS